MKIDDIKTPVSAISGVGPAAAKLFAKLNIFTVADLFKFYPKSYEDRRQRISLDKFKFGKVHTVAQVISHEFFGYGKMKTLKLIISDGTASASLICFNRAFLQHSLPVGSIIAVTGTFEIKYGQIQSTDFDTVKLSETGAIEDFADSPLPDSGILPVYHLTEGLSQKTIRKAVAAALAHYSKGIDSEIPEEFIKSRNLISKQDAIRQIHTSQSPSEIQDARRTLIYEELFNFQTTIAKRALLHKGSVPQATLPQNSDEITSPSQSYNDEAAENYTEKLSSFTKNLSPLQAELFQRLPFELTSDQMKVIDQMNRDIDSGYIERNNILTNNVAEFKTPFTMQRLLQGDVGSGKTLVAFFACLRIINWNGQCALMAPTEILARQHAENAAKLLESLGVKVAFLTGNVKAAGRTQLLKALKSGEINILIGTHALFSKQVVYNDLQLVVIDEQHRFGVVQRQAIIDKGRHTEANPSVTFEPHLLMMSATPIPQTLALTVFGDLDISVIRTMPKGRKPVTTYLVREGNERNAYEAVRQQLKQGRQAYFVYPAIDSDNVNAEIKSAEENFQNLSQNIFPDYRCALVHSKVEEEEQIQILKDFKDGKIQILAATTVIEVGVDVANATCIVIEQADRFGLAQLHQLRGRVGRGAEQSFCFLIYSNKITETGIERMKVLRQSTDGFEIAGKDLKLRGPGEITGTLQAGNLTLGIADIVRDHDILVQARYDAFTYIKQHN